MPRGKPKRGEFDFTIWYEDGSRIQWRSTRQQTDVEIADAIRRYLLPVVQRIESPQSVAAVDPVAPSVTK